MTATPDLEGATPAPTREPPARRKRRAAKPAGAPPSPQGAAGWLRHLFIEGPSVVELLRDAYFTFDRRTLGFTRILFGFLLIMDLVRRTPDWLTMYGDRGFLPAPFNLSRPQAPYAFTIVNGFVTAPDLALLWVLIFITYVCVLVGYRTKIAQILTVLWVTGMDGRVLFVENGGYTVFNLLAMWTAFLPMGDRFSVDAWRESMRRKRERTAGELNDRSDLIPEERLRPHVTLLGLVLVIQLSAVYFFNVLHKYGPDWRKDFTAVHYVLYNDRMVTPLVAQVRTSIPFWALWAMTKFVIGAESALPFCLLSPLARRWARLLAVVLMCILHIGFGTVFVLGPFAWALCVFSTLLFAREDWEDAIRAMRRPRRARVVLFDPGSSGALWAARALARLDRYELLRFEEEPGLPTGVAVRGPKGQRIHGAEGAAQIVAALPLGPIVAWLFRAPLLSSALGAIVALLESGRASRFFGVAMPPAEGPPAKTPRARLLARTGLAALREVGILVMFTAAVNQALIQLWVTKDRWNRLISELNGSDVVQALDVKLSTQPEALRALTQKLRFEQGWYMFSPNPVMDDGTTIVDAVTVDGRHIDPITGKAPDFDLPNVKSYGYNQIWSDYLNRIRMGANTQYREPLRQYLVRYHERTGRPEDEIVSGDVYWIEEMNPRFGDPSRRGFRFKKTKLFSFDREKIITAPRGGVED